MTAKSHHRGIFETIKIPLLWNNRDCEIPTMGKNWENKITALGIIWYKEIPVLGITGVMKIPLLWIFWVSPSPWMGIVEFAQTGILLEKSNKTPWISHIFPFLFPTGSFKKFPVTTCVAVWITVFPCSSLLSKIETSPFSTRKLVSPTVVTSPPMTSFSASKATTNS